MISSTKIKQIITNENQQLLEQIIQYDKVVLILSVQC